MFSSAAALEEHVNGGTEVMSAPILLLLLLVVKNALSVSPSDYEITTMIVKISRLLFKYINAYCS